MVFGNLLLVAKRELVEYYEYEIAHNKCYY